MIELFNKQGVRVIVEPGSEGHKRAVANGYGPAEAKKSEPEAAEPQAKAVKPKGKPAGKPDTGSGA